MKSKPSWVFDRDADWQALADFVGQSRSAPALGLVSGRRRQGKTFLLAALANAWGGFYFGADEATEAESLRRFADALAQYSGVPVQFTTWDNAISYLFSLSPAEPLPLIIDEFPMLIRAAPALPSILQRHLDSGQSPVAAPNRTRLLLCGSAMSVMGSLLAGQAPLRGRASLELVLRPLSFRDAARFWQLSDPRTALLVHAIVGGTPAYRTQFVRDDVPTGPDDFDDWVCRTVLNPTIPLFREARYLLAEDVGARDPGLYHSVLGAIASGNTTNGGIASYIGRKSPDIAHPLNVLEDASLVRREPDVLRKGRSTYRITEPLITFYQAIMRPQWAALELGAAWQVWQSARARFLAGVVGPHFEQICREWLATTQDVLPERPAVIGAGVIPTSGATAGPVQVDVVALSPAWPGERQRLLSLGEAKWGKRLGLRHLDRLTGARKALANQFETSGTVLALFSGTGFDPDLEAAAASRPDILLVGLDQLYQD
ncbi:MAG TPA: ATP-binding protein [Streptosporangiaceae bacterium]